MASGSVTSTTQRGPGRAGEAERGALPAATSGRAEPGSRYGQGGAARPAHVPTYRGARAIAALDLWHQPSCDKQRQRVDRDAHPQHAPVEVVSQGIQLSLIHI